MYHTLIGEGVKVLVLAEDWLWPFELNKLSEINDNFEALGKADVTLSESAQGSGVLIWGHRYVVAQGAGGYGYPNQWHQL